MIRPAAVAGRFYPSDARLLEAQIDELTPSASGKISALGCIVPHAGYMYSGHVAGAVYSSIHLRSRFILLGPRHYPQGARFAILSAGAWETPLGPAHLDSTLATELKNAFPLLREDAAAHAPEHALEVQLPFLLRLVGDFTFAPLLVATDRFDALEALGHAVASVVKAQEDPVMILASSDMNHYESDAVTRVKDRKAIDAILALDAQRLYETVRREEISMCGYAAAVAMLTAACDLGATKANVVRYATSADVTGDVKEVVGYAGITVE